MSETWLELASWTAVAVLGPGAVAIFAWFLVDLRKIIRQARERRESFGEGDGA